MNEVTQSRWKVGARLVGGAVLAGAVAATVVMATGVSWPTHEREPLSLEVVPAPADAVVVCPGPLLALGRDTTQAALLSVAAQARLVTGSAPADALVESVTLAAPDVAEGVGPASFAAAPTQGARVDLAAASGATASASDIQGFAAAACRPPLMESWLVGGSGATGAADMIVLSNPGTVAATVQLTVYGASGEQRPPGGAGIIVAAGSQRVIPLAGVALGESSPVVRVTAEGSPVLATLQTSIIRTLTPGGVDQVDAIAVPTTNPVIPAIVVTDSAIDAASQGVTTVLRMLAPTAEGTAVVTVTRYIDSAPVIEELTVPLALGVPTEVDLAGLSSGAHTVHVSADVAVAAAAWTTTGFGEGADFTWAAAAPGISVPTGFSVAEGPTPRLTVTNTSDTDAVITLDLAGQVQELTIPAHGGIQQALTHGGFYVIDPGTSSVLAAITYSGTRALSGYAIWPADTVTAAITVYP